MILWHRLDSGAIERAVQMLLRRLYPGCQAIDGSGGDGGRDVRFDSPDGLIIFEVKSFTDRLSSSQKSQIAKSLKTAATHNPIAWILILPLNSSPAEEKWFDGLRGKYPLIKLEWRGQDWLDGQFAQHGDLRRSVEGVDSDLLQRSAELNLESAVMANGLRDVQVRVGNLMRRADELSPFWAFGFTTTPQGNQITLFEKFPGAAEEDPISLRAEFAFPLDDPGAVAARNRLTDALDYGGEAEVDARHIGAFELIASPETKSLFGESFGENISQLQIVSVEDNDGLPIELVLCSVDAEGGELRSLPVKIDKRTWGSKGIRLQGKDSSGALGIEIRMNHPVDGILSSEFTISLSSVANKLPRSVGPVAELVLSLAPESSLVVKYGYSKLATFYFEDRAFPELEFAMRMVAALDGFQRNLGQNFPIPEEMSVRDVLELESIVKMLDEGEAIWPYSGITSSIKEGKVGWLLEKVHGTPGSDMGGALLVKFENWKYQISGREFDLGAVAMHSPHMIIENLAELEASVPFGGPQKAHWKCFEGSQIKIYSHKKRK